MSTTDKHTHIKPHETCVNIQDEMSLRTSLVLGLSTLSQTTNTGTAKQSITAGSKKKDTHNGHWIARYFIYRFTCLTSMMTFVPAFPVRLFSYTNIYIPSLTFPPYQKGTLVVLLPASLSGS